MSWQRLWDRVVRLLFGADVFISYARADSAYVLNLANALVDRGLSPYVDQWASPLGAELPLSLRAALRRSSMLLVVATPRSVRSENVGKEIREFVPMQRAVCVVDVSNALPGASWFAEVRGPQPIPEADSAFVRGNPSAEVIARLVACARFVRARARIRMFALAALSLMILASGVLVYFRFLARAAQLQANRETAKAVTAAASAAAQTRRAQEEGARADTESQRASQAILDGEVARRAQVAAEGDRATARAEADRLDRVVIARNLAAEASGLAASNPLRALQTALRSFELEYTPDGESALRFALATPRPSHVLPVPCRSVQFGLDKLLAIGVDGKVSIWETTTGALVTTLAASHVQTAEWSHAGTVIATTDGGSQVEIWDASTGQRTSVFDYPGRIAHASFGPHDDSILTAHDDGSVRGRYFSKGSIETLFTGEAPVARIWFDEYVVLWSHDPNMGYGRSVYAIGDDGKLKPLGPFPESYHNPPNRPQGRWMVLPDHFQDLERLSDPAPEYRAVPLAGTHLTITRDGTFGVTGSDRVASVWQPWTKRPVVVLGSHESAVKAADFSRDGRALATLTERGVVRLWPFAHKILFTGPDRPMLQLVTSLAFSTDGSVLVNGTRLGDYQIWDARSGAVRDLVEGPQQLELGKARVDFDVTGKLLLTSTQLGKVGVWDAQSRQALDRRTAPKGWLPRFSRNGRVLATAATEGGVAFLDFNADSEWTVDTESRYPALALTSDGRRTVSADERGRVTVRDSRDWRLLAAMGEAVPDARQIEINEDDRFVALRGKNEALVWQWQSGGQGVRLDVGGAEVTSMSPLSGRASVVLLAMGSKVRAYEVPTGSFLWEMDSLTQETTAVAYFPVGRVVASGGTATNTGVFIHLQACEACVARKELVDAARAAILALETEEAHIPRGTPVDAGAGPVAPVAPEIPSWDVHD